MGVWLTLKQRENTSRTDASWENVRVDFESAVKHLAMSGNLFNLGGFDDNGLEGYTSRMALLHSLQVGYTSLERGLRNVLNILGEGLDPFITDKELLKISSKEIKDQRPAILSAEAYQLAEKVRIFRRIAVRTDDNFVPKKYKKLITSAVHLSTILIEELSAFIEQIDPEFKYD